jgi:hypothetical protein
MIILRAFPNEDLSSDEIATHYRDWFRMSCSAAKISSSIKTLIKNKWVTKFDGGRVFTYTINDTKTPLKSLFGEKDNLGR